MLRRDFLKLTVSTGAALALSHNDASSALRAEEIDAFSPDNITRRGRYANSYYAFKTNKRGRVAFLGGSITEMDGYRPMVCEELTRRFPETEFEFIAAGISSTCSDVGAFRLANDVLGDDPTARPLDMLFVEFAVNDDQDGEFSYEHSLRGMEGIVRHALSACPYVDIVMTFFVNENLMAKYRAQDEATSIRAHKAVAERYGVSTINLAKEIQEQIDGKRITWDEFGGVHPAPRGNQICTRMIMSLLDGAWNVGLAKKTPSARRTPDPLDPFSYARGAFRGFEDVDLDHGFTVETPDWSKIPGSFRQTFAGQPCLCADKIGAETRFDFEGDALALYILAGPDAGIIEYQIDDGVSQKANLFKKHSGGLHYPCAVTLGDALQSGKHTVKLRMSDQKDGASRGNAARILQICVNR